MGQQISKASPWLRRRRRRKNKKKNKNADEDLPT
jgi:hypothetical protein